MPVVASASAVGKSTASSSASTVATSSNKFSGIGESKKPEPRIPNHVKVPLTSGSSSSNLPNVANANSPSSKFIDGATSDDDVSTLSELDYTIDGIAGGIDNDGNIDPKIDLEAAEEKLIDIADKKSFTHHFQPFFDRINAADTPADKAKWILITAILIIGEIADKAQGDKYGVTKAIDKAAAALPEIKDNPAIANLSINVDK